MDVLENKNEKYGNEAKERWGNTDAYREYASKHEGTPGEDTVAGMNAVFAEFARLMRSDALPDSAEVQSAVMTLQAYITEHFYTCTKEILAGLGQMYVADERFKKNIDKYGEGTAEFAADAIAAYTKKK